MGRKLSRRTVLAGAAAVGASMAVPIAVTAAQASPEFVAMRAKLDEALSVYRQAQRDRIAARERIGAEMRAAADPVRVFMHAPEAKARRRARIALCNAADNLLLSQARNEAEIALQEEARKAVYAALGEYKLSSGPLCGRSVSS